MILLIIIYFVFSNKNTYKTDLNKNKQKSLKEKEAKTKVDSKVYKLLIDYSKIELKSFIIATILMIFAVGMNLVVPIILGKAVTVLSKPVIDIKLIIIYIALFLTFIILAHIISYIQSVVLAKAGDKIVHKMREDVFKKLESLSAEQLNRTPVGKLVTRVTSDTNALNNMYTSTIVNLVENILTVIGVIVAMLITNFELALYVLITTPFVVILNVVFRYFSRKIYRKVRRGITDVNTSLSENISGVKLAQIFNQEQSRVEKFNKVNNNLKNSYSKQILVYGIFRPAIYVVYVITIVILFNISGNKTLDSAFAFDVGLIVIFYSFVERLFTPIQSLAEQYNIMQSAFAAAERVYEVLETKPEIVDKMMR